MERKDEKRNRQAYAKPTLRPIELLTEEVLGVGCKTPGVGGPYLVDCTAPSQCNMPGS